MSRGRRPAQPTRLEGADWLARPATQRVLGLLTDAGHGARVVGGAIRDALMGRPVRDVDIATTALPEVVIDAVREAGLGAIATGLAHGTVTVVADRIPFQVTTLRRDVETDGRRAVVAFTNDWTEDAGRRDFTLNALYCDADGTIHDPVSGYPDIAARRIRFIGEADARIREDYLRILRFFRFSAEFGEGPVDADGLAAAVRLKDGLASLSGERIRAELLRLLVAPRAAEIVALMSERGVFEAMLPVVVQPSLLLRVVAIERALGRAPDALTRLAALAAPRPGMATLLRDRLRFSNAEYDRLAGMTLPDAAWRADAPESVLKATLYRRGPDAFVDGILLAWALSEAPVDDGDWARKVTLAARWRLPRFPVGAADVLARSIKEGPAVGQILRDVEHWWIDAGFPDDPEDIARALDHSIASIRA